MDQIQTMPGEESPGEIEAGVVDVEIADVQSTEAADTAEMGELPVEDWDYQRPKRGQVRDGVILSIEEQEIIVDVGAKRDGIVPYADMQRMGPEALAELSVGDEVPVYILRPEDRDGNLLVSLYLARQEQAWHRAQKLADDDEIWEGEVIGYNKGGLVLPVGEIRGFIPASQVSGFPRGLSPEERLQRLADMVGESLMVKVIEINRRKRRLILSATAAQREWRTQHRERLLSELREGEVRRGRVSSFSSFGAFVDLGGADGLIHLSELSWKRVRHPREVVNVGEEVEVYVLRLDLDRKRIGLSLKRLQPEPWALVEDKYELGQLIEGVVTNVVDFGAFAEIDEGVEGLIHVSELTDESISHPREVVKKGDLLLLRIIRIDARRKRLGLSLKRVLESEWAEWAARLAVAEAEKQGPPEPEEVEEAAARVREEPVQVEELEPEMVEGPEEPTAVGLEEPAGGEEPELVVVEGPEEAPAELLEELVEVEEPELEVAEGVEEPLVGALEELAEVDELELTVAEGVEGAAAEVSEELVEVEEPELEVAEGVEEPLVEALEELAEVDELELTVAEGVEEAAAEVSEEPVEVEESEPELAPAEEEEELTAAVLEEPAEVEELGQPADGGAEELVEVQELELVEAEEPEEPAERVPEAVKAEEPDPEKDDGSEDLAATMSEESDEAQEPSAAQDAGAQEADASAAVSAEEMEPVVVEP